MKCIAVVLLLVAAISADEWTPKTPADLLAARQKCKAQFNVPPEKLEQYKAWNFLDDDVARSVVKCVLKELELFCDHQGFHNDRLIAQFQSAHSIDIGPKVEECVAKTDADTTNERWALRVFKCLTANHFHRPQSTNSH